MTREIKFRVWNEPMKRMSYFELFSPLWLTLAGDKRNTLPEYNYIMQFCGLKDKNGKEIYEGDIVKCVGGECLHEVIWEEARPFGTMGNWNLKGLRGHMIG